MKTHDIPADLYRIDRWLWASRFFKTRTLATEEIKLGRVSVNGQTIKPAYNLKIGDKVLIKKGEIHQEVEVLQLALQRKQASIVQAWYRETPSSLDARQKYLERKKYHIEPAKFIKDGRPTKRQRRSLEKASDAWNDRWTSEMD
ncbi:MAG: RNA-binding S4 domain-containing protein [Gammaproteobacteria bacterium]|nr:RNA-binding S4 domain-containing protein [Gammaproteobacteria bacterium]